MDSSRYEISDELWARIEPLVPPPPRRHPYGGGRDRFPARQALDAILYVLRTGCQWNALNQTRLCKSSTAHRRFQEWRDAGFFLRLWKLALEDYDELKGIDWSWQSMDGAMSKAPLGGEKGGAQPHGPRQGRRETKPTDRRHRHPLGAGG